MRIFEIAQSGLNFMPVTRMSNCGAVLFINWNIGAGTRLDILRAIAAALGRGVALEAAHESHRGRSRRDHRQNNG
jgi:hypothetical protein